jgi:pyridoxal/pyridoxine/pyridoxamine kinase
LQDLSTRGAPHAQRAILVGYLCKPTQAAVLARWAKLLRAAHSDLRIVIDPVMSDHDYGIYVDTGMAEAYRLAHRTDRPVNECRKRRCCSAYLADGAYPICRSTIS